jgi:hypothetical protein
MHPPMAFLTVPQIIIVLLVGVLVLWPRRPRGKRRDDAPLAI